MEDWQPIETAPKEYGKLLLLTVGFETKRTVTGMRQIDSGKEGFPDYWWILEDLGGMKATENYIGLPTHWMPLPEPAKQ